MSKLRAITVVSVFATTTMLAASCLGPPSTFVRTFNEPGAWKTLVVRDGADQDKVWTTAIDILSRKFDIETLDESSGYIRTAWKHNYIVSGSVVNRYRARIVMKTKEGMWDKIEIKCEAHWLGKSGWELGYDTLLLQDIYGDFQGKLGRVRR